MNRSNKKSAVILLKAALFLYATFCDEQSMLLYDNFPHRAIWHL